VTNVGRENALALPAARQARETVQGKPRGVDIFDAAGMNANQFSTLPSLAMHCW
jgi:hypothetical protein